MLGRLRREEGAQGIVEFALMMPFLFILVFGIIDFGNGLKTYITVSSAAREAARYASIGNAGTPPSGYVLCSSGSTNAVVQKACGTMGGLQQSKASVSVSCSTSCISGQTATVSTKFDYKYITPLKGVISLFSGGTLSDLTISASTAMRIE
ncbi:MAG: pilus assembly protein [Dehalococcoidia bacterium]|nr:pilus assembly protein [Dehalococcoidia bacterium]